MLDYIFVLIGGMIGGAFLGFMLGMLFAGGKDE